MTAKSQNLNIEHTITQKLKIELVSWHLSIKTQADHGVSEEIFFFPVVCVLATLTFSPQAISGELSINGIPIESKETSVKCENRAVCRCYRSDI